MFKRVQKRVWKLEKEEELGLDSEMKEVLGLQDTDSEESDSSSSESSSDDKGADWRAEEGDVEEEEVEEDSEEEMEGMESEAGEDSEAENEFPPMSATQAVSDPLYIISMDPDVRACILCPGKLLKNSRMEDVHKSSKAHNRRFTHFVELVSRAGPEGNVRDLIRQLNEESKVQIEPKPKEGGFSKRAEKRKAKLAIIKAKRAKHKEIVKRRRKQAEKAKTTDDTSKSSATPSDEPPRKRRKVEEKVEDKLAVKYVKTLSKPSKVTSAKDASKPLNKAEAKTKEDQPATPAVPSEEASAKPGTAIAKSLKEPLRASVRVKASNALKKSTEDAKVRRH